MGQDNDTIQPSKPSFWRDPRFYQITSLSTLLLYGLLVLHFDVSIWQIVITISTAQLMQYVGTRYFHLLFFDPKSALISSLSLCLLLRTNDCAVAALAAGIAIGSKFVIRWKNKHIFNPTNLALVVILASGLGWISPGQWGQVAWFGFLIACLGSLVITRAARADVTLAFLGYYIGLLFVRAFRLGDHSTASSGTAGAEPVPAQSACPLRCRPLSARPDVLRNIRRNNFQTRYLLSNPQTGTEDCLAATVYRQQVCDRYEHKAQTLMSLTGWNIDEIRKAVNLASLPEGKDRR